MTTPVIEASGLVKTYMSGARRQTAVDNASLRILPGDHVSIIGHSGSGKTTLLSLLGGLTRPDAGRVAIGGVDLWHIDDNARSDIRNEKLAFVFQFASLMPALSCLDNVLLPAALRRGGMRDATGMRQKAAELLAMVGLADKTDACPAELSGGQQRRVAIARAFINEPALVLADEPTGDLDEKTEAEIMALFARFNREKKTAFVLVTHSAALARGAERVLTMRQGVLEGAGGP